jgi:hypothetical protein
MGLKMYIPFSAEMMHKNIKNFDTYPAVLVNYLLR